MCPSQFIVFSLLCALIAGHAITCTYSIWPMVAKFSVYGIRHTGLVVKDLDNSLRFWRDMLGFSEIINQTESGPSLDKVLSLDNVNVSTVKLKSPDGQLLELLYFNSHQDIESRRLQTCSVGFTHIALSVSNIANLYQELVINGIEFNSEPQLSADGKVKMTYAISPEGAFVEFVEVLPS